MDLISYGWDWEVVPGTNRVQVGRTSTRMPRHVAVAQASLRLVEGAWEAPLAQPAPPSSRSAALHLKKPCPDCCRPDCPAARPQYVLAPGQAGANTSAADGTKIIRLPSDMALRTSKVFSYWAVSYALKPDAFTADFQRAMQRLLQVGGRRCRQVACSQRLGAP